jgi:hypothetical protein
MSLASVTWLWELLPLTLRQSSSSGKPAEITGLCAQGATLRAIGSQQSNDGNGVTEKQLQDWPPARSGLPQLVPAAFPSVRSSTTL